MRSGLQNVTKSLVLVKDGRATSNNAENYVVLTETFVCHVCISC